MFESIISLAATQAPEATSTRMPFGDAMGLGGSTTVIGVLIVFLGLVCLIIITWLYPKIALPLIGKSTAWKAARKEKKAAKKAAKAEAKRAIVTVASIEKAADTKATETKSADDPALIAVITAAIAASLGTSSNGIVIKSLRRTSAGTTPWGREAKSEQVYNRF